jgi:hypothetical protein
VLKLATKTQSKPNKKTETKEPSLTSAWNKAWDALAPIRSTWDEKEKALLAQVNDSVSGKITAARVSDAALSTLAYERQARVTAQLPTGKVYAVSKKDDKKAKLLNIVLNRYILPNADDQFDMLIKLRLWGVYASVYGSMPMFYDYRVDKRYIGPTCYLVEPRCFAPVDGMHNVQDAGCYISTIKHKSELEAILERKTTSYDKVKVKELLNLLKEGGPQKPTKDGNSQKTNTTVSQRYDLKGAKDRFEVVTKYTHDKWIEFAPDFANFKDGEDFIIREMDNPHKSGRIPVVMRHCFPLLNSIFGLGDFERGMKIQKAKDSIINLFLEGAKNRVYPPLKMIDKELTPSTIRYQAGSKWKVKRMDAVEAMTFGDAPLGEFQATFGALQGMLENQFGTSTTSVSKDEGAGAPGKSPMALKMQSSRENARDTWDRFMGEKATEELLEGMTNLLSVKMEKPINMTVFEDDIQALGYTDPDTQPEPADAAEAMQQAADDPEPIKGLDVFDGAKAGKLSLTKSDLKTDLHFSYLIDANSTMKQDEEEQMQALMMTWQLTHSDPMLEQRLAAKGLEYDEADHLKKIFIAAGISDWEKTLKEISPEKIKELQAQAAAGGAPVPGDPNAPAAGDPVAAMAQALTQGGGQPMQQQPMPPEAQPQPQMQPDPSQLQPQFPSFEDPDIANVANQILNGVAGVAQR